MIRDAVIDDVPAILDLIRQLADYEKEPDAVEATEESLAASLFGPDPAARVLVADLADNRIIGIAIYFFTFSTWTGTRSLYLEDLFVIPSERGHGAGRALMKALAARATENSCARFEWAVLKWNTPSIEFYESLGAIAMDGWTTYRLAGRALADLAR